MYFHLIEGNFSQCRSHHEEAENELVCCLRRSLILLWEGRSPPKRPVSPPLDSQRMASFVGTGSGFFLFIPLALTAVRGSIGNWSHNKQATARSTCAVHLTCGNWGQFKYFQNTSPSQNLSPGARGQHCSPPPQAIVAPGFLGVLGQAYLGWPVPVVSPEAPSYSCV